MEAHECAFVNATYERHVNIWVSHSRIFIHMLSLSTRVARQISLRISVARPRSSSFSQTPFC
jgi:hypothetical protein